MAETELGELLRNEAIRALLREAGPVVIREFLSQLRRLVKEGKLPRAMGDKLGDLLRARQGDVMVMLEQYPGLLALSKGNVEPIVAEMGHGILVVRREAAPYLSLFRSSVTHKQLVSLLMLLKERLFWGSYTLSPRSILDRPEVKKQFTRDFQELYDSKFRQAQDRIETRLAEFVGLQFKIEEYPARAGNVLREFVIGAQDVFRVLLDGLGRLSETGDDTIEAVGRSFAAFLNIVGMLYHFLALYAPQEIYRADELTYSLLKALQEYARPPAKSG